MSEIEDTTWPPKPDRLKSASDSAEMDKCPTCGRKLLTLRSVLCNWCGAVIKNEAYQHRAAEERAQVDAELRRQVESEQQETNRLGVIGRLKVMKKLGRKVDPLFEERPNRQ